MESFEREQRKHIFRTQPWGIFQFLGKRWKNRKKSSLKSHPGLHLFSSYPPTVGPLHSCYLFLKFQQRFPSPHCPSHRLFSRPFHTPKRFVTDRALDAESTSYRPTSHTRYVFYLKFVIKISQHSRKQLQTQTTRRAYPKACILAI